MENKVFTEQEFNEGVTALGEFAQHFYYRGVRDAFIGVAVGVVISAVIDVAAGTVVPFIKDKINERKCRKEEES